MAILTKEQWKDFCLQNPNHSLLQDAEWGELKSGFGWTPSYVRSGSAGAMVLFRSLPAGLKIAYIPRGPFGHGFEGLWPEIHALCRKKHAIFLRVEPDFWQGSDEAKALESSMEGFIPSFATVQPPRTILIPLDGTEDELLARMNQKTRYNIRLSQKKDLTIEESDNAVMFHQLMMLTGDRDAFGVHSEAYYQKCLECFAEGKKGRILLVRYQGKPLSAIMLFIEGKRGYYLYGASSNEQRNRMPNHLHNGLLSGSAEKPVVRSMTCGEFPMKTRKRLKPSFRTGMTVCGRSTVSSGDSAEKYCGPWVLTITSMIP